MSLPLCTLFDRNHGRDNIKISVGPSQSAYFIKSNSGYRIKIIIKATGLGMPKGEERIEVVCLDVQQEI